MSMDLIALWPFLASSYINLGLFTLEIALAVLYFFRRVERPPTRCVVGISLALLVDLAGTLVVCATTYLFLVWYPVKGEFPLHQIWTTPATIILNDISATIEQLFMIHRFWTLTKNAWITGILSSLVFVHLIFFLISSVWISVDTKLAPTFGFTATIIASAVRVAADVGIAFALVVKLGMLHSLYQSTRNLIKRITVHSVASGLTVAACTTIMLILLVLQFGAYNLFFACIGRVYSITVLTNLLTREGNRARTSHDPHTSHDLNEIQLSSVRFQPEGGVMEGHGRGGVKPRSLPAENETSPPRPQKVCLQGDDS